MEKFDKIYEKIHGGYWAIFTAISGLITVITSTILYYIGDPSITIPSHWISHLGAGPMGADVVFTIGLTIAGVCGLLFLIYLYRLLRPGNKETNHMLMLNFAFIFSLAAIIGLLLLAIFDMVGEPILHVTGSTTFMFSGMLMMIFISTSMLFNPDIPLNQTLISYGITGIFVIFLITFLPVTLDPSVDLMDLLTSTDTRASVTRVWEWILIYGIFAWFLEIGVYLKLRK